MGCEGHPYLGSLISLRQTRKHQSIEICIEMDKSEEISLESSLLGFCTLNKDVLFVRNHGIIVRNDEDYLRQSECVMLISGGGAGHEPGHNGYVGKGMLAASVTGNVFTSPSSDR